MVPIPVTALVTAISAILTPTNIQDITALVDKLVQLAEKIETTVVTDLKDVAADIKAKV
jgi:hypothetical protein